MRFKNKTQHAVVCCLQALTALALTCLCVVELLPPPAVGALGCYDKQRFCYLIVRASDQRQTILLAVVSTLMALLATCYYADFPSSSTLSLAPKISTNVTIATFNIIPVVIWVLTAGVLILQGDCAHTHVTDPGENCEYYWSVILDTFGVVTARLGRLDFALSMLLAVRSKWPWLLGVSSGWLGYPESMPIHRVVGWWCLGQSAAHSIIYFFFYLNRGGWLDVWTNMFPVPLTPGVANTSSISDLNFTGRDSNVTASDSACGFKRHCSITRGNFLGLVSFAFALVVLVSALPCFRKKCYQVFQFTHLPAALLFILFGALHDLEFLYFGIPGFAEWCLGRLTTCPCSQACQPRTTAKCKILPDTSGPWVELTIDLDPCLVTGDKRQPCGHWISVRVVPLGMEEHPLSVVIAPTHLTAWVSCQVGTNQWRCLNQQTLVLFINPSLCIYIIYISYAHSYYSFIHISIII